MDELIFKPEYFYDEVREGFYVSEMMKRFWASQLTVLSEIVKVCERHNLKWYADMGTLLGAIRHKGYVPWDDDLDISMNRDEWEVFFKYAPAELPDGYCVLNVRRDRDYDLSLGRITNAHSIDTRADHMKGFHGCPYVTGVDIYPIDKLFKDPEKESDRKRRGKDVYRACELIRTTGVASHESKKIISRIEQDNHVVLHGKTDIIRELVLLFERICMECRDDDYDELALNHTWVLWDWANCPKRDYESTIEVPFENTTLSITENYDELLTIYYHDYMKVVKGGGAHEYPIYRSQEQILREHIGHNPYRYTFDRADIPQVRTGSYPWDKATQILELMKQAPMQASNLIGAGNTGSAHELLNGCLNISGTLRDMLTERYGEYTTRLSELITEYSNLTTGIINGVDASEKGNLLQNLVNKADQVSDEIVSLCEYVPLTVLFLPVRAVWWDTMKPVYDRFVADVSYEVSVMPISYYDKDPVGGIGDRHDDSEYFKRLAESGELTGLKAEGSLDLATVHPDIIVTQFPFDDCSCSIGINEGYRTDCLRLQCEELWYVPCFAPDPPVSDDDKAVSAITVLTEQPAVVKADKVLLSNEALRNFYLKHLTVLSGEDSAEYWEQKIISL